MYPDEIATVRAVLFAYPDVVLLCKTREDEILVLNGRRWGGRGSCPRRIRCIVR